jgi:predicted dehydrogenase
MRSGWLVEQSPWAIAEECIQEGRLGHVCEVCVNEVLPPPSGGTDRARALDDWLQEWETKVELLLSPISARSTLASPSARSVLLQCEKGSIVRLFADTATTGPARDFEVIGTASSLVYRSQVGGLGTVVWNTSNGAQDFTCIRQSDVGPDLAHCGRNGPLVRLGIISLDHPHSIGNHFPALEHLGHAVRVVGIADGNRARCEPWLERFGAKHYPKRDDLLQDPEVDVVLVTSQNCHHAADAIAAAQAGKDVLCDKPIATTLDDTVAMVRACRESNVLFVTTYPCRFHPVMLDLKQAITEGRLGQVEAIMATNHGCMYQPGAPEWVKDPKRNGGGCIIDHTVHVADLMRWLTGQEFADVETLASSSHLGIESEDIAVMHGKMTGGTVFQIDASWSRKGPDPCWGDVTMRVVGTKGSASCDLYNNQAVQLYTKDGLELRYPNLLTHQHGMIFLDYREARATGTEGVNANAIDGLRTLELVFAAYRSVESGQRVNVEHSECSST